MGESLRTQVWFSTNTIAFTNIQTKRISGLGIVSQINSPLPALTNVLSLDSYARRNKLHLKLSHLYHSSKTHRHHHHHRWKLFLLLPQHHRDRPLPQSQEIWDTTNKELILDEDLTGIWNRWRRRQLNGGLVNSNSSPSAKGPSGEEFWKFTQKRLCVSTYPSMALGLLMGSNESIHRCIIDLT